ncbi:MAG: DUF4157 domain-containing protein [Proteobacteria bacterium]|nr:DUF4157 domain-containing protein [Pseudomonadota bacterium]
MHAKKEYQGMSSEAERADTKTDIRQEQTSESTQCRFSVSETIQKKPFKHADVSPKPNRTGIPARLKSGLENLSGYDLSSVRVHYNSPKPKQIGALAYTQGTNIHIGPGKQKHLPHEGWHAVQQMQNRVRPTMQAKGVSINDDPALENEADLMGKKAATQKSPNRLPTLQGNSATNEVGLKSLSVAATDTVQRDVGFEFESQLMLTRKSNTGALSDLGFPNERAARTVWDDARTTSLNKNDILLSKADVDIRADDGQNGSDLEVVTTHFPLNAGGRARLDQAMTDVNSLINTYTSLAVATNPSQIVPAVALDGTAGFNIGMNDAMIKGNWASALTAGQVTLGTRLKNVRDLVHDFHADPNENATEKASRDPGRLRMRNPETANPSEPKALGGMDEANTLVTGHTLAQNAIADYQSKDPNVPGGKELEGLLTIIFTYCESMKYKIAFLKQHTPLMAKTNLAVMFSTLPAPVKTYYSKKNKEGVSGLEELVATQGNYATRMDQPLFQGVRGVEEDDKFGKKDWRRREVAPWYYKLTLRQWLSGIVERGPNFRERRSSPAMRTGTDKLTNATFPGKPAKQEVEGYGALGAKMDTDINTNDDLPIFELRSASRLITYTNARQWALDFFDYMKSLNNNPGGGHQRMS